MKIANYDQKPLIIDILAKSFESNQSVNYIIKQDKKKEKRIRALMEYSFDMCYLFGDIYLSDNEKGCALVLYPEKAKTTLMAIWLDIKLIFSSVGIGNIKKTMERESLIKRIHPKELMYHLWFIGVDPMCQQTGIGTELLKELIADSKLKGRPLYLETSTLKNLPWYHKLGFMIYHEAELSYKLFFLKRILA
jgi:GNAT superfamily N-acetyltransferase